MLSEGGFPGEWTVRRVGDFAQVKGGKRLPLGNALTSTRTEHPYIPIVDLKDGRVDKSNLMFVPDEVFPQIASLLSHK
jgi:type I restriction enzyme S subunit